jgi:hypothetical protein
MKKPGKPLAFRFDEASVKGQLTHDLAFAEERLRSVGELRMMLSFRPGHEPETMYLMPIGWSGNDERELQIRLCRTLGIGLNARMVTLFTEAWMRDVTKRPGESDAEHEERAYGIKPSEAMDRVEVVVVSTAWRDNAGKTRLSGNVRKIVRDASGAFERLAPLHGGPADAEEMASGWLDKVLPPVDIGPADRQKAMDFIERLGIGISLTKMPSVH